MRENGDFQSRQKNGAIANDVGARQMGHNLPKKLRRPILFNRHSSRAFQVRIATRTVG
jgi:hypothetical protein